MSRKIRILSGKEVIKILLIFGFIETRTSGSHTRLTLCYEDEEVHITVPMHKELKKGTLRGIIAELEKCVSKKDIDLHFYTK